MPRAQMQDLEKIHKQRKEGYLGSSPRSCQHLEIRQRTWNHHHMVNETEWPERQEETQILKEHEFKKRTRFRK